MMSKTYISIEYVFVSETVGKSVCTFQNQFIFYDFLSNMWKINHHIGMWSYIVCCLGWRYALGQWAYRNSNFNQLGIVYIERDVCICVCLSSVVTQHVVVPYCHQCYSLCARTQLLYELLALYTGKGFETP